MLQDYLDAYLYDTIQCSTLGCYAKDCTSPFPEPHSGTIRLLELLSEEKKLDLVVDGQDTSTSDTTENVSTSTLEERLSTLLGDNLAGSVHGRAVLDGL